MRLLRIFLALGLLLGSVAPLEAENVFVTGGSMSVRMPLGDPRSAPAVVYVDNIARSLDNLVTTAGGTFKGGTDNTVNPSAALIVCNGDIHFGFGGVTPTATLGVKLPSGGSWVLQGSAWLDNTNKLISTTATDNVACPGVVLIY